MPKKRYTDTQSYDLKLDASGVLFGFGKCSFFGGGPKIDPMDSGATASGFSTKDHPESPYIALPGPVRRKYRIRWGTLITVENKAGKQMRGRLMDTGPAEQTGRQIDLSPVFGTELGIETDQIVKFYVDLDDVVSPFQWQF
jgi:hypothetical protein